LTGLLIRQVETCPVLYDMNWQDCLRKVWTDSVLCKLTGLFKTSLDLSSFVWWGLTGLFKTSLEETQEILNGRKIKNWKGVKELENKI
jgi:hypothetical protein